ncbi:MAG: NADH-quinone oxidoreductase subunit C [Chloroflexi bacterium]|nr:NADH-quinone oxidoreductase subunit C [Chloroflexota bacterium]
MTKKLSGQTLAKQIQERFPNSVAASDETSVVVNAPALLDVARYLKETPELAFDYLTCVTGLDYFDYLEVAYNLTSLQHNHSLLLKARCHDTENPSVPSLVSLWRGADLQEREIYDLLGISFPGHPNLKRIVLWEGFPGNPLRKAFL